MHFSIRKAQAKDAEILFVLATEAAAFEKAMMREDVDILLCCKDDFITGYLKLTTDQTTLDSRYGTAEVATLYVRRHLGRRGSVCR